MKSNDKKNKNNKKHKNKFNDYTSFLNPEIVASDPQGMYTGVPADMYYNGELEKPVITFKEGKKKKAYGWIKTR